MDETIIHTEQEFQDFLKSHKKTDRFSFECQKCGGVFSYYLRKIYHLPVFCKTCKNKKLKVDTPIHVSSMDDVVLKRDKYTQTQLVAYTCPDCKVSNTITLRAIKNYPIYCKTCNTKRTNLLRYGVECAQKSEAVQAKRKETCNKRYGGVGLASDKLKEKASKTNLERYGVVNPMQSGDVSTKSVNTRQEIYGKDYLPNAIKEACMEKYGVENPMQVESICQKAMDTKASRYGKDFFAEIIKASSQKKYGTDNPMQDESVRQKALETLKELYGEKYFPERMEKFFKENFGVSNAMQVPEIFQDAWNTKLAKYGSPENFPNAIAAHQKFLNDRKSQVDALNIEWLDSDTFHGKYDTKPIYYRFKCLKCGNEFQDDFHSGLPICRVCNPNKIGTSNQEETLNDFIKSIYTGTVIRHDRNVLGGKELDFYFPELNLAIEYNGTYWHGYRKDTKLSVAEFKRQVEWKRVECEKKNIRLVTIDEADYLDRPEVFNRFIQDLLLPRRRVFARKCTIKEISTGVAKEFCEYYHVNGFKGGYCKLGLYLGDELLVVAVFGKHPRYQNECIRLVYKTGVDVIGGWAKIVAHFGKPFLHYVNLKYFRGENKTGCGYRFWIRGKLIYRQQVQKKYLQYYCNNINPDISDFSNCLLNGGIAVFDVGNDIRFYNMEV